MDAKETINLEEIWTAVEAKNGKRRSRIITKADIDILLDEINQADEKTHTIRVYPNYAFVANAYKYRAETTALQADRDEAGNWTVNVRLVDAHRPKGTGPKITRNGR